MGLGLVGDYSSDNGTDLVGPDSGSTVCIRGGCWYYGARSTRVSDRNDTTPRTATTSWVFVSRGLPLNPRELVV